MYGRVFTSQSDIYMLPSDNTEHTRLDLQHYALRCHLNSLYPYQHLIHYALRKDQNPHPEILDVGTGSGRWAVEMAAEFPHAFVTGMDLTPPTQLNQSDIPPNCRFELDDANLSMGHYTGMFNLVHVRSADAGINNFERFLFELAQTLRPGGILLLVTGFAQVWDDKQQPFPPRRPTDRDFCGTQHVLSCARQAYHNRGNFAIEASHKWQGWLEENPNYRDVVTTDYFIPLGPWMPNMSDRDILTSNLMREDIAHIVHALRPLLLADGHSETDVDGWINAAVTELKELKVPGLMKWRYTIAIRTDEEWQEMVERAPDLSNVTPLGPTI